MILLEPKVSPGAKLLVILAFALFWNGIVSVFVAEAVKGWRAGHPDWWLTLFLVPFVVIGLGFLGGVVYLFLALFNPRPRLRVTPGTVRLGNTLQVQWEITGRVHVLERLRLRLEGREEATYRRGTSSSTDRSVFADLEIANVTTRPELWSGSGSVTIPANLMYSFASEHNKIIWALQVHGQIARWPDLQEEFPVTVLPASAASPALP